MADPIDVERVLHDTQRQLCLLAFGRDCQGKVSMCSPAFHLVMDRLARLARLAGRLAEHSCVGCATFEDAPECIDKAELRAELERALKEGA